MREGGERLCDAGVLGPGGRQDGRELPGVEGDEDRQDSEEDQVREQAEGPGEHRRGQVEDLAEVQRAGDVVDLLLVDAEGLQPVADIRGDVVELRRVLGHELCQLGDGDDQGDDHRDHDQVHGQDGDQGGQPGGHALAFQPRPDRVHRDHQDERQDRRREEVVDGPHPTGRDRGRGQSDQDHEGARQGRTRRHGVLTTRGSACRRRSRAPPRSPRSRRRPRSPRRSRHVEVSQTGGDREQDAVDHQGEAQRDHGEGRDQPGSGRATGHQREDQDTPSSDTARLDRHRVQQRRRQPERRRTTQQMSSRITMSTPCRRRRHARTSRSRHADDRPARGQYRSGLPNWGSPAAGDCGRVHNHGGDQGPGLGGDSSVGTRSGGARGRLRAPHERRDRHPPLHLRAHRREPRLVVAAQAPGRRPP